MQIEKLKAYFLEIRTKTEDLVAPLAIEDFVPQPIMDTSPPKWHLAHTTWFFEHFILKVFYSAYQPFHPKFHYLFNSYYQQAGKLWDRGARGDLSRPTVKAIFDYRKHVNENMTAFLASNQDEATLREVSRRLLIGCNHEQQHQELLMTDLKFLWGTNPLFPSLNKASDHTTEAKLYQKGYPKNIKQQKQELNEDYFTFKGNDGSDTITAEVGTDFLSPQDINHFCYDNETPKHKVLLQPFKIAKKLVTHKAYMAFVKDGGYQNPAYWHDEGWSWVEEGKLKSPLYIYHDRDEIYEYDVYFGMRKVLDDSPVKHLSYFEAAAFAKWAGKRLPTEFEWEYAAQHLDLNEQTKGTFQASNDTKEKDLVAGYQFYGVLWQWTESAYLPYPGYKSEDGALGEYNGKFMINQMVLRGGSIATPKNHYRNTYRNFFPAHTQFQFSGIRLADNI